MIKAFIDVDYARVGRPIRFTVVDAQPPLDRIARITWEPVQRHAFVEPTLRPEDVADSRQFLQAIVDAAQEFGIRATQAKSSDDHLADMRRIAFHLLKIGDKP
jgi:hypothetical protein